MQSISWEKVTPSYLQLTPIIEDVSSIPHTSFEQLQPRFAAALSDFIELQRHCRLMWVCGLDNTRYRQLVTEAARRMVSSSHHNIDVINTESSSLAQLFGHYSVAKNGEILNQSIGLLESHPESIIVLPIRTLMTEPGAWEKIKSLILGEPVTKCHLHGPSLSAPITYSTNAKLIFVGDRTQISDVEYHDSAALSSLTLFSEIELEIKLDQNNVAPYVGWLKHLAEPLHISLADSDAVTKVLTAGARACEEQHYTPLCPIWIERLLSESLLQSQSQAISASDIEAALAKRAYRESYLVNRALDDILDGQVVIKTKGSQIGQVNGLTVVDIPGHPVSYGEPARISCVVHFGDGDIADVERKADLGGNLHAKGMMIMQAYISSEMKLDEPLPFSASIVFEQSYSEVDGDSASLAEFCALSSALSQSPIKQHIAITGAMDQFGQVQAVGGLNEKIEGFFYVCHHQGLSGEQGVIMPSANLRHLALHKDVIEAIRAGRFHIWCVDNVDQALEILIGMPFKNAEQSVVNKIEDRIHQLDNPHPSQTVLQKFKQWLKMD
jgi:Lon-like ATP-dependent protease